MASLKDTLIQGSARVTDTLYTTTAQLTSLLAPTAAGGTTFGPGTNGQVLKSNGTSAYWAADTDTNTHRPIQVNGTEILGNNTTVLNLKAGSNVSITNSSGTVTIAATDTTYSSKSAASGGTDISLVTTGEKYTWNNKSNLAIGTSATTAAAGNHTHSISIATSTGTNQITLAANTKYSITAGGQSYIFTTPPDNNTDTKVTSVGNHYAPSADDNSKLIANASGATAAWSIDVVKGISIERDAKGHVTGVSVVSGKIPGNPNTDTKNTAGSTDTSSKIFLIGATSQAANPQTYSHDTAYVDTDGCLYSGGAKVLTSHQDISGKKNTQTAVSDPTAAGTATSFIKTISQNAQGVITPTKASLPTASTSAAGIVQLNNTLTSTSTTQALTAAQGKVLNDKIDAIPTSTLRDVPFGIGTGDWTASDGSYVATVSSTYVTTTSREWVTFDNTFRSYAKGDISVDKVNSGGGITLTTSAVPSGTIQGVLYIIDTNDGKVPVLIEGTVTPIANGGTGQSTVSGAQNALGITDLSSRIATKKFDTIEQFKALFDSMELYQTYNFNAVSVVSEYITGHNSVASGIITRPNNNNLDVLWVTNAGQSTGSSRYNSVNDRITINDTNGSINAINSNIPIVKTFNLPRNGVLHIRLNTYSTGGMIACSVSNNSYCEYIFSNGYFSRVHETEDIVANFDSTTYKDITFTNNVNHVGYLICLFPVNVTIEQVT